MRVVLSACLILLGSCFGGSEPASEEVPVLERWTLSAEPSLSIGVVEGDEPYQLFGAGSSVRLPNGRIAVVNTGSEEVRIFGPAGDFLGSFGQEGDGPGEFRQPTNIQYLSGDTLRVWDQRLRRFSFHDGSGTLIEVQRLGLGKKMGEPFPVDVWLYRRHLIDSPLAPEKRGALVAGVMALPELGSVAARHVLVTEQGRLWTTNIPVPRDSLVTWQVFELDGTPLASTILPARFEPHQVGPDFILGRWFDELDVNYIRLYGLQKPSGSRAGPGLGGVRSAMDQPVMYVPEDVARDVRPMLTGFFKNLATRQELNYSEAMTYTDDMSELEVEIPDDVRVDFLAAGPEGWMGIATHMPTGAYCALSYGREIPMGWNPGEFICPGF